MSKFVINHRLKGLHVDKRKQLYTSSLTGKTVYGETTYKQDGGIYRNWDPYRSKLGAALRLGVSQIGIKPGSFVLYLGAASGTTVSHVADMVGKDGGVYALDSSPVTTRQLMHNVVEHWPNVAPLLYSARYPEMYKKYVDEVDVIFQDIAQKDQVQIFLDNCALYLKKGGFGLLSIKAKSIDVTASPKKIFADVAKVLEQHTIIVDKRVLEPYQKNHAFFVIKWRK